MSIRRASYRALATLATACLPPPASGAPTGQPAPDGKPADLSKPVQVFILMGQSNMVGLGKIAALETAVKEKKYTMDVGEAMRQAMADLLKNRK